MKTRLTLKAFTNQLRNLVASLMLPALLVAVCALPAAAQSASSVEMKWLGNKGPATPIGVSWGTPWPQGKVRKDQAFTLTTAGGKSLPLQSWPLAYWPDGSIKWSGFATLADPETNGSLILSPSATAAHTSGPVVQVRQSDTTFEIDTGRLKVSITRWGADLIDSMVVDGREVARHGRLICILQDGADGDAENAPSREKYSTKVERVTMEQSGPVRAVAKIEGKHRGSKSNREWLPFVVRLYFYAGQVSVRMVHTVVYDGDESRDFIRGLGVAFSAPMREQVHNRHVRFSGEGLGLWSEPIQPMIGRGGRFVANPQTGADVYPDQIAGRRVPNKEAYNARGQGLLADWAVWDDFKLVQPSADGFTVLKRTNPESAWIPAGAGSRASGLVFAGDVSGGLAVSLKNFWQSYPASLEARKAAGAAAELIVWMWSPEAPGMDMRHYDTRPHGLEAVYEDVQPGFSTAHGVARTSELTLFATTAVPSKEETAKMARAGAEPPLLVCAPQHLHLASAFGVWGLEDRSTPVKRAIEERLAATLDFYSKQIDQRNWYGFWDYGDVMHSYDNERHVWRYDLGGMAWDNTELGTDMWLWYSFLRTGRADIFRMAEAMTRHTSEVDIYHLGRFAGLGSRHNVRHWGCGAKEARISQAAYRRFYYYLTTDERTGDIMREVLNVDYKVAEYDPMRLAQPITEAEKKYPTRVRLGPDWLAFVSNWMTEWERTGDTKWRDKILAGVESFSRMPLGLRSGKNLLFGYDPATGLLYQLSDEAGQYNLATIMGGAEVVFELDLMLDDDRWRKLWLQYCRLNDAPRDVIAKDMSTGTEGNDASFIRDGRLASFVYLKTKNPAFMKVGVNALLASGRGRRNEAIRKVEGPESLNPVDESGLAGTNGAAQNGLTTIISLGMVGDHLPAEFPPQESSPSDRERGAQRPNQRPPGN
jgi:PcRGLX-like protein C-terminal alpha/alpha toroid domain/PcRGLX-like protein central beta sandwich domain/PcRGLX-like N-terminal RIFT barrel domain